ncbi:putative F-box domain-containing protein [Tanacetum coccineum]
MTEFGHDIDEEILLRLEANDLIRYKSVCKSWYSLISSTRFINSHLNYNLRKKADNNEIGDTRITALTITSMCCDDCFYLRRYECQVVGSSNGLVCVSRYHTDFLVVNPSTREVKELRHPPRAYNHSLNVSGFGYDSSIDDYKVVIGYWNEDRKYVFEVLTFKSNVWRSVAVESGYDYLLGNGILCNGAIHWFRNDEQVIVSFDLSKEVLNEIPLPKLGDQKGSWTLGTMKDRLCIFRFPNINLEENEEIEIWVMRNDNVQVSWERRIPPPGYDAPKATIHYCPHKRFFTGRHVHIWMLEEGSCAPVLVRRIERPGHEFGYLQPCISQNQAA